MRQIISLAIVAVLALATAGTAHATSRFTIDNSSLERIKLRIFNGDDGDCLAEKGAIFAEKSVPSFKQRSYGCKGSGKDRCKITPLDPQVGGRICKDLLNTCNGKAIIMPDGATLVITGRYKLDAKGNSYYDQTCYVDKKLKDNAQ